MWPEQFGPAEKHVDFEAMLQEWVEVTLRNEWVAVPLPGGECHDFTLITDSCRLGFCGIAISNKTGQATVISGKWPFDHELLSSSATTEPLGVAVTLKAFFKPYAASRVLLLTDNTGQCGEIVKSYGTKEGAFISEWIQKNFPRLRLNVEYYRGEAIATDEGSRGKKTDINKLNAMAADYNLDITSIREFRF